MDLFKAKSSIVVMRVVGATMWVLKTHWFNHRTHLCPSKLCPRCELERPKPRAYAIAIARGTALPLLLELSTDTTTQLLTKGLDPARAAGWTWTMVRREGRPGWNVQQLVRCDPSLIDVQPNAFLAAALEQLYALPPAFQKVGPDPTQTEWLAAHQSVLTRRMNLESHRQ